MGIGPASLALLHHLAQTRNIVSGGQVIELGGQLLTVGNYTTLLSQCFAAAGVNAPPAEDIHTLDGKPARELYEGMGLRYKSVDTDGQFGALVMDLNLDSVPDEHKAAYDLVTNFGTTEHVFDQVNSFRIIHDFAKRNGLMLHVLPFQGEDFVDHCFYCYQPDFFISLAKANGYQLEGLWAIPNTGVAALIPWSGGVGQMQSFPRSTCIAVLLRKTSDLPFQLPYQSKYESSHSPSNAARYSYVVDGELINGAALQKISGKHSRARFDEIPMRRMISTTISELVRRVKKRLR